MEVNQNQIKKTKKILLMPPFTKTVFRWFRRRRADQAPSSSTTRCNKECRRVVPTMPILPEDVITNIFSRLPIECVARSRAVCKRWLVLFSSPHFARMHVNRAPHGVLLLQNLCYLIPFHDSSLVVLTGNDTKPCTYNLMKMIGTDPASLYGSCDGLLVFRRGFVDYLICNPITREQVTIKQPVTSLTRTCCGILFHQGFKENLVLFHEKMTDPQVYEYSTYGVSSKLWRKTCSFAYKPSEGSSPIVYNSRLHWVAFNGSNATTASNCNNCIVTCDMDLEDFCSMPHPGEKCDDEEKKRRESHGYMQLLEMKGVLCFGDYDSGNLIIRIWTMEDYGSWSWLLNFNIFLRTMDLKYVDHYKPKLLRMEDDRLMFSWGEEELIVYHLIHKTKRRYGLPQLYLAQFNRAMVSYTKSFISLRS